MTSFQGSDNEHLQVLAICCVHAYTHTYTHGSNSATQTSHEYAKDKSWSHDYGDIAVLS